MKQKLSVDGLEFDSLDEVLFYRWLKEAKNSGFINDWQRCDTFTLSDKVNKINAKGKVVTLQREVTYTPDFKFIFNQYKSENYFFGIDSPCEYADSVFYVDVKGSSQKNMRSKSTSSVTFPVKRAWLYQKHGIWVHKVIVDEWFKLTWCPDCPEIWAQKKPYVYSRFDGMKLNNGDVLKSDENRRRK